MEQNNIIRSTLSPGYWQYLLKELLPLNQRTFTSERPGLVICITLPEPVPVRFELQSPDIAWQWLVQWLLHIRVVVKAHGDEIAAESGMLVWFVELEMLVQLLLLQSTQSNAEQWTEWKPSLLKPILLLVTLKTPSHGACSCKGFTSKDDAPCKIRNCKGQWTGRD